MFFGPECFCFVLFCFVFLQTQSLLEILNKKSKSVQVKPQQVKNHLSIFINCLVENPTFDSQTKENMTLKVSAFGSKASLSDEFLKKSRLPFFLMIINDFCGSL